MAAEAESRAFGGTPLKEEEGDTFLTDLIGGPKGKGDSAKRPKGTKSAVKPKGANFETDSEMQDIEEELRDVVFDYENSQAVVAMADNFLKGGDPKPFDFTQGDNQSTYSRASKASDQSRVS